MYAKVIILAFLAIAVFEVYAQTASQINCGQVQIPPMTPLQLWNPYVWYLPGWIAASNCYTGYLQGVQTALTDLYNAAYTAGPPQQTGGTRN